MKNLNKILALIVGVLAVFIMAKFTANAMGSPAAFLPVLSVLLVLGLIPRTKEIGTLFVDASPDLSAIASYAGKNARKLHRRLLTGLDIAKDITPMYGIKHAEQLTKLVIKNGPKPYTGDFKARNNDISYTDRQIVVDKFQRDILIHPSKYRTSYLGEKREAGEGANNMSIPFAQFTNEAIIDENSSILNNQTAFFGIGKSAFTAFNPATAYTGTGTEFISFISDGDINYFKVISATTAGQTPVTNPDKFENVNALAITIGLGTKINQGRTSQDITRVSSTGAITSDDAYEQFQMVWRNLPDELRRKGAIIYSSLNSHDCLLDSIEEKVSKHTVLDLGITYLPKTNKKCMILPASWMGSSQQLICTTKENLIYGTDGASDFNTIRVLPDVYTLKYSITGVLGFQYQDGDAISMNDM